MSNLDLKALRENSGLTQKELSEKLGITTRTIINWEGGGVIPKGKRELLQRFFENFTSGQSESFHVTENIPVRDAFELAEFENNNANLFSALPNGQYVMTMPLAEIRIQAGLLDHYQDLDYFKDLEQHSIIVEKPARGRYMAFRVSGDSMDDGSKDSIPAGYIVSTRELQRHHWTSKLRFKDYRFWVIYTTQSRMPLLKEIVGHDVEKGIITCHSLNDSPEYTDFELSLNDVKMLFYVIDIHRKAAKDEYY